LTLRPNANSIHHTSPFRQHMSSSNPRTGKDSHVTKTSPGPTPPAVSYDATVIPTTDAIVDLKAARELDEAALRTIFSRARTAKASSITCTSRTAHTCSGACPPWANERQTGFPLRLVFVESAEAKEKLRPSLRAGNLEKTMAAPVTAIIATDLKFYEQFPRTFPDRGEMLKGMVAADGARGATRIRVGQRGLADGVPHRCASFARSRHRADGRLRPEDSSMKRSSPAADGRRNT